MLQIEGRQPGHARRLFGNDNFGRGPAVFNDAGGRIYSMRQYRRNARRNQQSMYPFIMHEPVLILFLTTKMHKKHKDFVNYVLLCGYF